MRPVRDPLRQGGAAALVDEASHALDIVDLPRDENFKIVGQADEAAVEHPMRGARQGDSVLDDIRSAMLHRPDMGGIDLGAPTAIDEFQTGHRATRIVGARNDLAAGMLVDSVAGTDQDRDLDRLKSIMNDAL